jgi:hypothetical protein
MPRAGSVWERCRCADASIRELAEKELRDMPAGDFIAGAVALGIRLSEDGDLLRVRGPRGTEGIARLLLGRKTEVLTALRLRGEPTAEDASNPPLTAACSPSPAADTTSRDAERAAAIIAKVDALIDEALKAASVAASPARRNVLANERAIVRRLAREGDPLLGTWPQALERLLARWQEWDDARAL